jgi:probable H4MPT-linked C1 transfer pathway protein
MILMHCLALDIGGANLKYSDGGRFVGAQPFALWRHPERLADALRQLTADGPAVRGYAVTMTGELADCFASKAEGVAFILDAVRQAIGNRPLAVYLTDGRLVAPEIAILQPLLAAASNWHVLARFVGRYAADGWAVLLDVGSTTCDVIPISQGQPSPVGWDDTSRLLSGELVYTGVERSPVCGLAGRSVYRGQSCPLAQELFATARDVYLILGQLAEVPEDCDTADGRPATRAAAIGRLGRMICADQSQFTADDAAAMARDLAEQQIRQVSAAARQVVSRLPAPPQTAIVSGHGEFLARRVLAGIASAARVVSLADELGPEIARAAPAHALATLVHEGCWI